MPDKPTWYCRLDVAIAELEALPHPWIDRAAVEQLLLIGRRRAQQMLAACGSHRIGSSYAADRDRLIAYLKQLAAGDAADYEQRRRRHLATEINRLRQAWLERPRVLVEAPAQIVNQTFAGLAGVRVEPGRITVEFDNPQTGLERLLGLAMAIGNNREEFEKLSSLPLDF
jgi:hypothetical protein